MNTKYRVIAACAALLLAGAAMAGDRGPRHDRGPMGMGAEVIEHFARALRQLDLSEDQKTAIHEDLRGLRESVRPLVHEMFETRKALHQQITADAYDSDAVAELATRQGSISAEITIIASEVAAGVLAQLTDEQRAELHALAEARRAHREAHRELKRQRRGRPDDTES